MSDTPTKPEASPGTDPGAVPEAARYPVGTEEIGRIALLTNPAAGHGASTHATERAMRRFQELGVEVIAMQGVDPDDARKMCRVAIEDDRLDALVVCGGDGMVRLALQEQAGSGKPLGIIPAGTGNDHAREYRLPRDSAERAAEVVAAGFTTTTDLGLVTDSQGGEHWFGTVMCAGFDSLVSDRVNRMTWPHGRNRYNLAIVVEFLNFHSLPFRIVLDDGAEVIDRPITMAAFGNTRSYGGGMNVCPDADHADGLLDLTIVERTGRIKAAMSFGRIFKGTHTELPEVSTYRARRAVVESEGINAYSDGDLVAPLPVTVEAVPAVGRYIVPRP